jgi:2-phosphosulfolactate phosphatase
MTPTLDVYGLPRYVEPERLRGGTAVVIDALRAATTIACVLDAGAREIVPCLDISDAWAAAERLPAGEVVLGGEREGEAIERFDLGNSPNEYTPERVGGKTVVFTTTNGTRAMETARAADEVLIASFVTASAVVRRLFDREHIHIICAGTDGNITEDDVFLAGLLAERLRREAGWAYQESSATITARERWLRAFPPPSSLGDGTFDAARLAAELRTTLGARNLLVLGFDDDIVAASRIDRFDFAPRLDGEAIRIA